MNILNLNQDNQFTEDTQIMMDFESIKKNNIIKSFNLDHLSFQKVNRSISEEENEKKIKNLEKKNEFGLNEDENNFDIESQMSIGFPIPENDFSENHSKHFSKGSIVKNLNKSNCSFDTPEKTHFDKNNEDKVKSVNSEKNILISKRKMFKDLSNVKIVESNMKNDFSTLKSNIFDPTKAQIFFKDILRESVNIYKEYDSKKTIKCHIKKEKIKESEKDIEKLNSYMYNKEKEVSDCEVKSIKSNSFFTKSEDEEDLKKRINEDQESDDFGDQYQSKPDRSDLINGKIKIKRHKKTKSCNSNFLTSNFTFFEKNSESKDKVNRAKCQNLFKTSIFEEDLVSNPKKFSYKYFDYQNMSKKSNGFKMPDQVLNQSPNYHHKNPNDSLKTSIMEIVNVYLQQNVENSKMIKDLDQILNMLFTEFIHFKRKLENKMSNQAMTKNLNSIARNIAKLKAEMIDLKTSSKKQTSNILRISNIK
jgi:hypothetical protein